MSRTQMRAHQPNCFPPRRAFWGPRRRLYNFKYRCASRNSDTPDPSNRPMAGGPGQALLAQTRRRSATTFRGSQAALAAPRSPLPRQRSTTLPPREVRDDVGRSVRYCAATIGLVHHPQLPNHGRTVQLGNEPDGRSARGLLPRWPGGPRCQHYADDPGCEGRPE